jgi:beta-galactosidase
MQAQTATGSASILIVPPKPFPIVSYCSEPFFTEVERWLDAACPILARHQYPDGRIVMVQADNEHSYFFKLSPYDVDYSDSALAQYRDVLQQRYGSIDALNQTYGTSHASFEELEPPRDFDAGGARDLPAHLDWIEAKERYITVGIARIRDMLVSRGLDRIPISHNTPQVFATPCNEPAMEREVDVQGIDFYAHVEDYDDFKRVCLYLTGTSRLPFIPEFGAGTWPWWRPATLVDGEANALRALMHGIKAFNYYMLVERERWMGSPIGRRGDVREPDAMFYRRFLRFLSENEFWSFERQADVLLLYGRDYERHALASHVLSPPFFPEASSLFSGLTNHRGFEIASGRELGLGRCVPRDLRAWWNGAYDALVRSNHAFAIGDTDSDPAWLARYRAIVCPGFAYLSADVQRRLVDFVRGGGILMVGPELPTLDERMLPCTLLRQERGVRLIERAESVPEALAEEGILPPVRLDNPLTDVAVHRVGERAMLFIANVTDKPQRVTFELKGGQSVRGCWQGGELQGKGAFVDQLPPHAIHVWEAQQC